MDPTFELEKRRNRPVKYDRDLVGATLRAMARAQEVQAKRAAAHHKNRMVKHRENDAGARARRSPSTARGGRRHLRGRGPAVCLIAYPSSSPRRRRRRASRARVELQCVLRSASLPA